MHICPTAWDVQIAHHNNLPALFQQLVDAFTKGGKPLQLEVKPCARWALAGVGRVQVEQDKGAMVCGQHTALPLQLWIACKGVCQQIDWTSCIEIYRSIDVWFLIIALQLCALQRRLVFAPRCAQHSPMRDALFALVTCCYSKTAHLTANCQCERRWQRTAGAQKWRSHCSLSCPLNSTRSSQSPARAARSAGCRLLPASSLACRRCLHRAMQRTAAASHAAVRRS